MVLFAAIVKTMSHAKLDVGSLLEAICVAAASETPKPIIKATSQLCWVSQLPLGIYLQYFPHHTYRYLPNQRLFFTLVSLS